MKMLDVEVCGSKNSEVVKNVKDGKRISENYDEVEGLWGYLVCLGLSTVFVITVGPAASVGLLFEEFLQTIGDVTKALTLAFGIGNAVVAFSGMLTTYALKKYSLRSVGLFGAGVYCVSSLLFIFMSSMSMFIFLAGIVQPVGVGIMMSISLTSFNTYFHKKRASMMSLASVFIGAGAVAFPTLIEKMMETYGFRGTLAILSAINLHVIPGIAVMQPAKWHRKPKNKAFNGNGFNTKFSNIDENCNERNTMTAVEEPLLRVNGSFIFTKNKNSKRTFEEREMETLLSRSSSIASIGNITGNPMIAEAFPSEGKWKSLIDFLDLGLFKDSVYCNICFGITLSIFADISFFGLEPAILSSLGYSKIEIANCITIGAFADVVSRILFVFAAFWTRPKSRVVFFIGNFFMIVFRIAFVQRTDLNYLMIMTGCLGFFRHWILTNGPLIFADHFGIEKFPAAYGLYMMVSGFTNLMLGPLAGYIKEFSNDFDAVIWYLVACSSFCAVPWIIEFMFHKIKIKFKTPVNKNNNNQNIRKQTK